MSQDHNDNEQDQAASTNGVAADDEVHDLVGDASQPSDERRMPRRFAAGDGRGEYVYRRRGPFGRARDDAREMKRLWLENAVPSDEEQPIEPGTLTYTMVGTWKRKALTMGVAVLAASLMGVFVIAQML